MVPGRTGIANFDQCITEQFLLPRECPLLDNRRNPRSSCRVDRTQIATSCWVNGGRTPKYYRGCHGPGRAIGVVEGWSRERILFDDSDQGLIVIDAVAATNNCLSVVARVPGKTETRAPVVRVVQLHSTTKGRVCTGIGEAI